MANDDTTTQNNPTATTGQINAGASGSNSAAASGPPTGQQTQAPVKSTKELLKLAKASRKSARTAVTRKINELKSLLKTTAVPDLDDLEDGVTLLLQREEDLIQAEQAVKPLIENDADLEKDQDEAIIYQEEIGGIKLKINRMIKKLGGTPPASSSASLYGSRPASIAGSSAASISGAPASITGSSLALNATSNVTNSTQEKIEIKLPTLTIEKYNGDYSKWNHFWGRFKVTVHNSTKIDKVDKLIYLTSYLEGEALQAIMNFEHTEDAYDEAVEVLKNRFSNTELAMYSHLNKLKEIQQVSSSKNILGLRQLLNSCEISVRSLKSMGYNVAEKASSTCPELLSRLPSDIRTAYCVHRKEKQSASSGPIDINKTWDIEDLINFIRSQIESREMAELIGGSGGNNGGKKETQQKEKSKPNLRYTPSATSLSTGIKRNNQPYNPENVFCIFCSNSDHKSIHCKKYTLEQKRSSVRESGRCYVCLRFGHDLASCRSRFRNCRKCHKKHNYAVCEENENHLKCNENKTNENLTIVQALTRVDNSAEKTVQLQTAIAFAKNPSNSLNKIKVRCVLDGGSQISVIREDLSRKLNLPVVGKQCLDIFRYAKKEPETVNCRTVKVRLENRSYPEKYIEFVAVESPYVCNQIVSMGCKEIEEFMEAKGLQMSDDPTDPINDKTEADILIGGDIYWEVASCKFERFNKRVVCMETMFGWALHGPSGQSTNQIKQGSVMFVNVTQKKVDETLQNFFDLESLGITSQELKETSDDATVTSFFNDIKFNGERYVVKFPWKCPKELLPNNEQIAKKRLLGLIRKFERDPTYFQSYKGVIEEQLETGVLERVPAEKHENPPPGMYYMPHQGVTREEALTTKLRVVNDASSGTPSLNDCLSPGPNLNPDILLLLLRFRTNKIAIVADIEKAFLQIALDNSDKDSTRFIWVKEENGKILTNDFEILRMNRVPFGVTSSTFLLACTIKFHVKNTENLDPRVKQKLNNDLYVDDLTSGVNNVAEGYEISVEAASVMQKAGMRFRKWGTNSLELKELWENHPNIVEKELFEKEIDMKERKILGLRWDPTSDSLAFNLGQLTQTLQNPKNTKRFVLSSVAQIFDPMGIISPFTIRAKILFQKLWVAKLSWDADLGEELGSEFESWTKEVQLLQNLKIDRHYFEGADDELTGGVELHCFCDSSKKAYAAVIYARYKTKLGKTGVTLVTAKARVAPLKLLKDQELSLPKLELMGCLLGARLTNYIKPIFGPSLEKIYYWTDSTIALAWVTGTAKNWKPFISNRASEIQTLTDTNTWFHCPGIQNPADLPTRGIKGGDLENCALWWKGPEWLGEAENKWPKHRPDKVDMSTVAHEKRKVTSLALNVNEKIGIQKIINLNRHNSLDKNLRITTYVLRFIKNLKDKTGNKIKGPITAEEMELAEIIWVKAIQAEIYEPELNSLKNGEKLESISKLITLRPILNMQGLICVGGRLEESSLSYREKHPILLNKNEKLAKLLMIRSHKQVGHAGINDTITQLRERYWLPAGKQLARSIVKDCLTCKKLSVKPGDTPTAALPHDRVNECPPFSIMGIDFAGPLLVKARDGMKKAYICLATCAVTRAIHLELIPSLSTDDFMLAFRRIIARRGVPSVVYTDNAKTFKRADADLKLIWQHLNREQLEEFFGTHGIVWKYIIERAAWYGGWWEILVKSTKTALKKNIGNTSLTYAEMQTAISETEAIINSRPITYVYNDVGEPTPLSPAEILIGRRVTALPPLNQSLKNVTTSRVEINKRIKYRDLLISKFWNRFRHEYLMGLRTAHYCDATKKLSEIKKDDIVIIVDDKLKRHMWKLGRVIEMIKGRDGQNRSCVVKTTKGSTIRRSLKQLCNLEITDVAHNSN